MAITQYISEEGIILWKVYVNVRSKTNPGFRSQKKLKGIKTQREAEREETKLIRECEREIFGKETKGAAWGSIVNAWEEYLSQEKKTSLSEITRLDYVAAIRNHTAEWKHISAAGISTLNIKEVLNGVRNEGGTQGFQKRLKRLINQVFSFGIEMGLIKGLERSPAVGIQFERTEEKKPEILTTSQIRKLLSDAKRMGHTWYPVWAMALMTGMRNGELYALQWGDINWENKLISVNKSYNCRMKKVKSTKAGYWRTIPISSELLSFLQELKIQTGKYPHVLLRNQTWTRGGQASELRQFCDALGIPSVRFHALRACFATQLIQNGVPAIMIQKICGWKDLKTMQQYIRMSGVEVEGATEGLKMLPTPSLDELIAVE